MARRHSSELVGLGAEAVPATEAVAGPVEPFFDPDFADSASRIFCCSATRTNCLSSGESAFTHLTAVDGVMRFLTLN